MLRATGAVLWSHVSQVAGHACGRCSRQAYLLASLHTVIFGWWSLHSILVTPGFILHNLLMLIRGAVVTSVRKGAHDGRR